MKVTCIIPTLANEVTRPYLELCVRSLRETTDWTIVVVVNGKPASEPLPELSGMCTVLQTKDQGQCNAVNIGVQLASPDTDYLFISNDDMYYAPGWNRNLRFDHPVFSPNLVEPLDNAGSAPPFRKLNGGNDLQSFKKLLVDTYVSDVVQTVAREDEDGFNLPFFVRKDVWDTIGGYDVAYDPWGSSSDTDLQMKLELAGVKPVRLRDVLVYHFSNKSGTFDGTHQDFWQNNWDYLESKWGANRDQLGSDTWYCKNMLPPDNLLKYRPDWEGKYNEE